MRKEIKWKMENKELNELKKIVKVLKETDQRIIV